MINGNTILIAHLGYPTTTFTAPMIYNPYFDKAGINARVMPMGVKADDYPPVLSALFKLTNFRGALVTMPHKATTLGLVDEVSPTASIAGASNTILRRPDGRTIADIFDGEGFVRGMQRKGRGASAVTALVVGSGGVGSAIAASLAKAGVARLRLFDVNRGTTEALAMRLRRHYPTLQLEPGSADPTGCDVVVNATPLGMNEGDALPIDIGKVAPSAFVGEVVLKPTTPFLLAARAKGCTTQVGVDMLFEQIPACLEFFGFPATTAEQLRTLAKLEI